MSLDAGNAISEAFERITTQAALVLIGLYAITAVIQTAAMQDIVRELVLWFRDVAEDELSAQEYRDLVDATDPMLNDLPLALGLDLVPAIALLIVALVAGVVIVAVAIDAFARGVDSVGDVGTSGVLWHTLNLLVGGFVLGVLVALGFAFFFVPGLILLVLFAYFPVAVVVDDENFPSALGSSVSTVTDNLGPTVLLLLVVIAVGVGVGIASSIVTFALPGAIAGVVGAAFSAASALFGLAVLTRGYVAAHAEPAGDDAAPGAGTAAP